MILTLVVPGMLWPRQVMRDTLYDTSFPALQTLLSKGRRLPAACTSIEAWWSSYFGIEPGDFAAAPLRLSAHAELPGTARWLCADPVHLRVEQKGAALTDPALLNISALEARQFHAAVAPLFAAIGDLILTTPSHWHVRLSDSNRNATPKLPAYLNEIIEQPAVTLLPQGDEAFPWRQLINEAQMILHAHPLNKERSAQGKARINSLALWGEGKAPSPEAKSTFTLLSDDLIITGAGRLAGMQTSTLPPKFRDFGNDCIAYLDFLRFSTAHHDALAWREGLLQLEQCWIAPALIALKKGKIKRIDLHGFGTAEAFSIAMTAFDCYRFWRQPRRLESP